MSKGIIFYTDNQLREPVASKVIETLKKADLPIVSCSLKPLDLGTNIVLDLQRGKHTMFKQQLAALEALDTEYVFFCEHDCLYPDEHFNYTPPNHYQFFYNQNWWKIGKEDIAVHWDADQVSGLCCYRPLAIEWYRLMVNTYKEDSFDRKYEPESGEGSGVWWSDVPYIDVRHNHNLTYNKWELKHFRNKDTAVNFKKIIIDDIPGWSGLREIIGE